jgi:hypothetical protein
VKRFTRTGLGGGPLKVGETMIVTERDANGEVLRTTFTVYRPARRCSESPVQYFKRTKCCPDSYHHVHKGRYYCNPAHCSRSWTDKIERDKHLVGAYAVLD